MSTARIMGEREFETNLPGMLPDEAIRLGPDHYPTGHRTSALAMVNAIDATGLTILEQTHVVDGMRTPRIGGGTVSGANLFSLFKVAHPAFGGDGQALIGYRNSVAQAFAASACIGVHFPICTNVSLFGQDIIFKHKNTKYADLPGRMRWEIGNRVIPMLETVQDQLDKLTSRKIVNHVTGHDARRTLAWRALHEKVLPLKQLGAIEDLLNDCSQAPEIHENEDNALGLMHTFTRVIRDMPIRQQAAASQKISRFFGFGTNAGLAN